MLPLGGLLYLLGRFDRAAVTREWDMILSRATEDYIGHWEEQARVEPELAGLTFDAALAKREGHEVEEAKRLLAVSYSIFCGATQDRVVRLRGMAVCARMASAFVPLVPVRPADFRLREVSALAGLGQVFHHLLVTGAERFVLRAQVISFGLRLVLRAMNRSKDGVTAEQWRQFSDGREDWSTLDEAHIETLRALMKSFNAERRERVLALFP
ncbi:MAG: hypothetical protein ABI565_08530 [Vicinamibacteria bacterium]